MLIDVQLLDLGDEVGARVQVMARVGVWRGVPCWRFAAYYRVDHRWTVAAPANDGCAAPGYAEWRIDPDDVGSWVAPPAWHADATDTEEQRIRGIFRAVRAAAEMSNAPPPHLLNAHDFL